MQMNTKRLILCAATEQALVSELAYIRDANQLLAFEQTLGAQVISWPPLYNDESTCTYSLEKLTANPDNLGWWQWYALLRRVSDSPLLVALAGFHGPPDDGGNVEIGYSVIESFQRRGIATEVVKALSGWAFSHHEVAKVSITTFDTPEFLPSTKVALKSGFRLIGTRESVEGDLLVYELERQGYTLAADHGS
jgi:RimJ/RimL family protein N-acetyltransferase